MVTESTNVHISRYSLEGTQEEVINCINEAFDIARGKLANPDQCKLYLDWQPRQYDEGDDLYVYVSRPETQDEAARRIADDRARKQQVEQHELKVLADLLQKYPNGKPRSVRGTAH